MGWVSSGGPTDPLGGSFGIPTLGPRATPDKGWRLAYWYRWQQEVAERRAAVPRHGWVNAMLIGDVGPVPSAGSACPYGAALPDGAGAEAVGNGVGEAIGGRVAIGPLPSG